jgi:hypothetical protein
VAKRGQEIFLNDGLGKCNICHRNAGANRADANNANFNTGVEDLPDQPARLTGEKVPRDDGFGKPGDGTFNTPPLVEAADTGPFFHNNAIETIEGAVAFYNGQAFNNSPSGRFLASTDPNGVGIRLDATQVVAVAAFLRVLNALENIRQSIALLEAGAAKGFRARMEAERLLDQAESETGDAIRVLKAGGLHPEAVAHLERSKTLIDDASNSLFSRGSLTKRAIEEQQRARRQLVASP